jgi:hypothetical protein
MDLKAFPKIRILAQALFLVIVGCAIILFTDNSLMDKRQFGYVFAGLIVFSLILVFGLALYVDFARQRGYRIRTSLKLKPRGEGRGGKIFLNLHNVGDGMVRIVSAGLLDRYWVPAFTRFHTPIDIPRHTRHANLPFTLNRGEVLRLEFDVLPIMFAHTFSGVFYEIDLQASEANNQYAKYLSKADLNGDGYGEDILRQPIIDMRLHGLFCGGPLPLSSKRFLLIVGFVATWLFLILLLLFIFG